MQTIEDVTRYRPADPVNVPLNFRGTRAMSSALDDLVRLWQEFAKARGEDPSGIDRSHVLRQLVEGGIATEFSEFGGRPADESGWRDVVAAIRKSTTKR